MLLPALCLMKIAFPIVLRYATACSLSNEDCGESISQSFEVCYCLLSVKSVGVEYCKSGNFRCKNIFIVDRSYENKINCMRILLTYVNTKKFFKRNFSYTKISRFMVHVPLVQHMLLHQCGKCSHHNQYHHYERKIQSGDLSLKIYKI